MDKILNRWPLGPAIVIAAFILGSMFQAIATHARPQLEDCARIYVKALEHIAAAESEKVLYSARVLHNGSASTYALLYVACREKNR